MIAYYLWFKGVHVAFMVTWFAGLFYLPRLFIYHAEASDDVSRDRFVVMERRLFAIMTLGAIVTLVFGLVLLWLNPGLMSQGWFHAKLTLLVGLAVFHYSCRGWMRKLAGGYQATDTRGLRWYNEIPVFFLLGIILLAVAKPF
jgi:putative membrane protein